jgi:hypothetical protein
MMPTEKRSDVPWRISRAILYGLMLQLLTNVISALTDGGKDVALWWNASAVEMIAHFTGMMLPLPLIFVVIALIHNWRLRKRQPAA